MNKGPEIINRRTAISRLVRPALLVAGAYLLHSTTEPVSAQTPGLKFQDSPLSYPVLPQELHNPDTVANTIWGNFNLTGRMFVDPASPKPISEPEAGKSDVHGAMISQGVVLQESDLLIIRTRIELSANGSAGILHGGDMSDDRILTEILINGENQLVAQVRRGFDFSKPPIDKVIVDKFDGPTGESRTLDLDMMLANGGRTFGIFGFDGRLRKIRELEAATAEPGQPSFLNSWSKGGSSPAVIRSCVVASANLV